jgi:hypothetical protein
MSRQNVQAPLSKKAANERVGRLSNPSKMPCHSWSIPAVNCTTGAKLVKVPGSVCHGCYALKGMYRFPNVKDALSRRLDILREALSDETARAEFVAAFTVLLEGKPFFRWHDSGDLQGHKHLDIICEIARALPETMFWLPTREYALLNTYLGAIPGNLIIRVSAHMVDGAAPSGFSHTSTVHSNGDHQGVECGAYKRDGKCGDCRACWSPKVQNVSYPKH